MSTTAMIHHTASTLLQPGTVAELRILHTPRNGTVSGYFDNGQAFTRAASGWSGKAPAVYCTLNPCKPALLARSANRLKDRVKTTTSDPDILQRWWLPLDFDPVRPADISSTDDEHAAALQRAASCAEWLTQRGWPSPVVADSGNGGHLLYRIDLPNDDASRLLLQHCLEALALYFSDDGVALDVTVFNAARIWKVYGTMACKGDNLPERPHRLSRLLNVPATLTCVSPQQLADLAALLPTPTTSAPRRGAPSTQAFDLHAWISRHDLPIAHQGPWQQGGTRWVLNPCPWNGEHTNKSAFVVQFANGAIAAGCHHNGCHGKDWPALRDLYEPGWQTPRHTDQPRYARPVPDMAKPSGHAESLGGPPEKEQHALPRLKTISARELYAKPIAPRQDVVEGILPVGATLFVGRGKDGKSLAMWNLCLAVAEGGKAFGHYPVHQGDVLYMALEDGERRGQKRLAEQMLHMGAEEPPANLDFVFWDAPRVGEGLETQLTLWLDDHPNARLVVIDILEKVRPRRTRNGSVYADDYAAVAPLQQLAQDRGFALVIVHHSNKTKPEDFRDTASGSNGLLAACDTFWSLFRVAGAPDAVLRIIGRDVDAQELAMQFQDGFWTVIGDAETYQLSKESREVLDALTKAGKPLTPKQLATILDLPVVNVRMRLSRMLARREVVNYGDGYIPSHSTPPTREREESGEQEPVTPVMGVMPVMGVTPVTLGQNGTHVDIQGDAEVSQRNRHNRGVTGGGVTPVTSVSGENIESYSDDKASVTGVTPITGTAPFNGHTRPPTLCPHCKRQPTWLIRDAGYGCCYCQKITCFEEASHA